ncbi:WSC domain-containing protein 2 [Armadillidium vulgare]|nr:WSC domain-containing protein 2 [Armadillidium vulgare]
MSIPLRIPYEKHHSFTVQFGKNLPLAYLVSYPRSGNTWIRYLIEATTGLATGSLYISDLLINMGYLGEGENPYGGTVIIVKSHCFGAENKSFDDIYKYEIPVVLLLRNPYRYAHNYCLITYIFN